MELGTFSMLFICISSQMQFALISEVLQSLGHSDWFHRASTVNMHGAQAYFGPLISWGGGGDLIPDSFIFPLLLNISESLLRPARAVLDRKHAATNRAP